MFVAGFSPSKSELLIINEAGFLKSEDGRICDLVFNAPGLEMSEKLALTFCTCYQRIKRNRMSYFVRVRALASLNLCVLQRN
jgi:hypothetical protein